MNYDRPPTIKLKDKTTHTKFTVEIHTGEGHSSNYTYNHTLTYIQDTPQSPHIQDKSLKVSAPSTNKKGNRLHHIINTYFGRRMQIH